MVYALRLVTSLGPISLVEGERSRLFKVDHKFMFERVIQKISTIGVWQGVAMDSLKFQPGPPCLSLLCPVGVTP
jgi:hypothetical protein